MRDPNNLTEEEKLSLLMDGEWRGLSTERSVAAICSDQALRDKWARYHIIRDSMNGEPVRTDNELASSISMAIADEPTYSNVCAFNADEADEASGEQNASAVVSSELVDQNSSAQSIDFAGTQQKTPSNAEHISNAETPSWLNTGLVGLSLAASVAMITVVGLNMSEEQGGSPFSSSVASVVQPVQTSESLESSDVQSLAGRASGTDLSTPHVPEVELVANTGAFWMSPESSTRVAHEERLNRMLSLHIESSPTAVREGFLPHSRFVRHKEISQ